MSDLNLLPSQAKFQAERIRLKNLITNFLWVFGGIWVLLLVGVLLMELVLNLQLKSLNKKYDQVSVQYQSLAGSMVLNQKIKYQAKVVAKVLVDRFEYGKSMRLARDLFSENIKIDDLEVNELKKVQISGGVTSGDRLSEVEKTVDKINSGLVDGFESAEITDVSVDAIKGWRFAMEVVLK